MQNSTRHDIRHELNSCLHILVMGSVILFLLQTPVCALTWTQVTANAAWSARWLHTSVVFDNEIWVIGGESNTNDVWKTGPIAVELIDFSAVGRHGFVELSWRTEAEIDNMKWLIIRCVGAYDNTPTEDYEQIATLPAEGSLSDYQYIDSLVVPGVYWYKLGDVDNSGNISWHGPISARVRGQPQGLPLRLEQPIPSPFRKEARIEYQVIDNRLVVVENVPVEVCSQCGETLYTPSTIRKLEKLVWAKPKPKKEIKVPVLDMQTAKV